MPLNISFVPFAFVAFCATDSEEALREEQQQAFLLEKARQRFLLLTEAELSGLLDQIRGDFMGGRIPAASYIFMKNFVEERILALRDPGNSACSSPPLPDKDATASSGNAIE